MLKHPLRPAKPISSVREPLIVYLIWSGQNSAASGPAAEARRTLLTAGELVSMRTNLPPQPHTASVKAAVVRNRGLEPPYFRCPLPVSSLAILAAGAALLAAVALLGAQTPAPEPTDPANASAPRPMHTHKRPNAAHPLVAPAPVDPVATEPVTPPAPEPPKWPAYDPAAQASIVWDSQGLQIEAQNSSLQQILKDVSTATGAKVEGFSSDQRVFGEYGPGKARDVLSQLLQGSGYNVIMIGDEGGGVPRQILLSSRQAGNAPPAPKAVPTNNNEDDEPEDPPAPPDPPANRPGFQPGAPPRSPQQILQEMQQRQQQMQQQPNQQQQQPNPQN